MARPIKMGLDYFPMDVQLDDKVELIEARHGITGFGVLIKLYQRIYKEGYFIKLTEEALLLFSKRINVNINEVNDIINDCIKYELFNDDLFKKYKILTSAGIQKRYLMAVDRRKEIELIEKYIIVDINEVNVNIKWINEDISTQSKVNKSKVNKSKIYPPDFLTFWNAYPRKEAKPKALQSWLKADRPEMDKILATLNRQKQSRQWTKDDGEFIPLPATYINQERWNDEKDVTNEVDMEFINSLKK